MDNKIFLIMLLLHIIEDFHLQGILKEMKQKRWWLEQKGYKDLYKNDYMTALAIHSISWSIFISLPLFFCVNVSTLLLTISITLNAIIHYYVDDLKCNKMKINLGTDQLIHLIQIWITWLLIGLLS